MTFKNGHLTIDHMILRNTPIFSFYNNHCTKCFSSFCYLGYFSSAFPWCLLIIMKVSWTLGNCQIRHITWILTDYLASGWLFCLILQTEYLLYFLLVFIDWYKLLWISEKPSDITISGNYANLVEVFTLTLILCNMTCRKPSKF